MTSHMTRHMTTRMTSRLTSHMASHTTSHMTWCLQALSAYMVMTRPAVTQQSLPQQQQQQPQQQSGTSAAHNAKALRCKQLFNVFQSVQRALAQVSYSSGMIYPKTQMLCLHLSPQDSKN